MTFTIVEVDDGGPTGVLLDVSVLGEPIGSREDEIKGREPG